MTDEEINALTDQQINVMMTAAVNELHDSYHESGDDKTKIYQWYSSDELREFKVEDYCNDPAVMMPIAAKQGIGMAFDSDETVTAFAVDGGVTVWMGECDFETDLYHKEDSDKYCRSLAIVYLKMREVL